MVDKNVSEWRNDLTKDQRKELDELLLSRLGVATVGSSERNEAVVSEILSRGYIENEDQFRVVLTYADEMYDYNPNSSDLERANELLATFEDKLRLARQSNRS